VAAEEGVGEGVEEGGGSTTGTRHEGHPQEEEEEEEGHPPGGVIRGRAPAHPASVTARVRVLHAGILLRVGLILAVPVHEDFPESTKVDSTIRRIMLKNYSNS
jgi:hypothetical protein